MNNWGLRTIVAIVIVAGLLALFLFKEDHAVSTPMGEVIGPDEDKAMAGAIGSALAIINNTRAAAITKQDAEGAGAGPVYGRDVHTKSSVA